MTTIEIKNKEVISLNNTAEEQLRVMLVEKNNECNALLDQIELLKRNIKEEQDGKYRAYVKISDLQNQIKLLKTQKKD
jgi:chromosome segregation ATPase|tara:strand:- start:886 stop:1119 length:234 start_codon:yes stop_codon:yes gene_type:complete